METPLDDLNTERPKNKGSFGQVLVWNFAFMLGFMTLTGLAGQAEASMILDLFLMVLQVIINLILGIIFLVRQRTYSGLACFLSAFLVIIVGFGMCAGKAALLGG